MRKNEISLLKLSGGAAHLRSLEEILAALLICFPYFYHNHTTAWLCYDFAACAWP